MKKKVLFLIDCFDFISYEYEHLSTDQFYIYMNIRYRIIDDFDKLKELYNCMKKYYYIGVDTESVPVVGLALLQIAIEITYLVR